MGILGSLFSRGKQKKRKRKRITGKDVRGLAQEVRKTAELVVDEEEDVDQRETRLGNWLSGLNGTPSPAELQKALEEGENIEEELEDIIQRMEKAIQQKAKMIEKVRQAEQVVGKEEYSISQELQDISRNIGKMEEGGLTKEDADYVVKELLDVSVKIEAASEDMEELALMIYDLERTESMELQAEGHLEQEVGRFKEELKALKRLIREAGTEQEARFEEKLETIERKIEEQLETELNQESQQLNAEKNTISQLKKGVEEFTSELETFRTEVNRVESDLPQSSVYKEDEQAIQQAIGNVQEAQQRMEGVSGKLQSEEAQFQDIQKMAGQAGSMAKKIFSN